VLIKPNFVVTDKPLAATHADAVRAVLDLVREHYDGPLTIAEGPSTQPAAEGFRHYGYEALARDYEARLFDLNHDEPVSVEVFDWRLRPLRLQMAKSVVESDFRISVGPPKTHDMVIVTLSLKNMIMGSLISRFTWDRQPGEEAGSRETNNSRGSLTKTLWRMIPGWILQMPPVEWMQFRALATLQPSDKMKMHQSHAVLNLNLAKLAPLVMPHLAVIDGFQAMEGNGPTQGTPVPLRLALASVDALAADTVATSLMGFDVDDIGYLHYCKEMGLGVGDLASIELVGNTTIEECKHPFRPHDTYHRQRQWRLAPTRIPPLRDAPTMMAGRNLQ
jgi:uncharacterized protein (DUF362 family)